MKNWKIYLAGEIHSDWRQRLIDAVATENLPVEFFSPVTDHGASDNCGVSILGQEASSFWKDHKGAKVNALRTRALLQKADWVVVKFGEKYRQWNAAFDAGYAVAIGKPLITIHPEEFDHALKEIDGSAQAVARDEAQVVQLIRYAICGELE